MTYEFVEEVSLFLPNFEEQLSDFSGTNFTESHGLIVEIAALHEGATSNFNMYSASELEKSLSSWTSPYPKPVIMNHDPHSEPIGRVIGAKMDKEESGTPFVRLQAAILDPIAIQKVSDGRYLTGSVGGKANEAICSICNTDWAHPKETRQLPCRHNRGKVYSGKVAFIEMKDIAFKEYSFVNVPSDTKSSIRSMGSTGESDGWVKPTKFFVLDMQEQSVFEYTESENRDVFDGLRKKDSLPIYMGLKGAFLTAIAIHESEQEETSIQNGVKSHTDNTNEFDSLISKENNMAKDAPQVTEEDDILAIVEDLQEESVLVEDPNVADETIPEIPEEVATDETPADEKDGERPESQEVPHARDIDPETSKGAPVNREEDEESAEVVEPEPEAEAVEEPVVATEEPAEDSEKAELTDTDEPHADESLEVQFAALEEENARLKKALHRTLVERVVDAKILVGIVEADQRASVVQDHANRTASSLADTLRDISGMPVATSKIKLNTVNDLKINETSEVVEDEQNVTTIGEEVENSEVKASPLQKAEDLFVDVLMHRKNL